MDQQHSKRTIGERQIDEFALIGRYNRLASRPLGDTDVSAFRVAERDDQPFHLRGGQQGQDRDEVFSASRLDKTRNETQRFRSRTRRR